MITKKQRTKDVAQRYNACLEPPSEGLGVAQG